jgi:hypothetical protein
MEHALFDSFSGFFRRAMAEGDRVNVALFDVVHGVPVPQNSVVAQLVENAEQARMQRAVQAESEVRAAERRLKLETEGRM